VKIPLLDTQRSEKESDMSTNKEPQPDIDKNIARPDREPKVGDPLRDPSSEKRKQDPDPSHDANISKQDRSRDR
jgi:hypothetical protein